MRIATTFLLVCLSLPALATDGPTDAWIDQLEGGWYGESNATPMGDMPFALIFDRQDDGSLRAFTGFNQETWIELRFHRDGDGAWMMEEAAAMEGLGEQRQPLRANGPHDRGWRFGGAKDLVIDVVVDDERLDLDVDLRGRDHVHFLLDRVNDDEVPALRTTLAEQAARTTEESGSFMDAIASLPAAEPSEDADDPIAVARRAVYAAPDDARTHMGLAQALIAAIEADPASAPMHAGSLIQSLQTAHELDPDWDEPYHGLVGYYLQAPAIAGGSIEKAEQTARALARIDAEASAALLEQVEAKRAASEGDR